MLALTSGKAYASATTLSFHVDTLVHARQDTSTAGRGGSEGSRADALVSNLVECTEFRTVGRLDNAFECHRVLDISLRGVAYTEVGCIRGAFANAAHTAVGFAAIAALELTRAATGPGLYIEGAAIGTSQRRGWRRRCW
jgi:hypothetical protein